MNGTDPSLPKITQLVGHTVQGWFHHGPGVFLAFTDGQQELRALKLVPHRARDGSAQLHAELVDAQQLLRVLSVATQEIEQHSALLQHVESLFQRTC